MWLGKYTPLRNGPGDTSAVDIEPVHLARTSHSRHWGVIAILGVLCFLEGLALLWMIQNPTNLSSHMFFQNEEPFSTAFTQEEVERAWGIYGLRE